MTSDFKSLKTNPTPFERHWEQVNALLRDYQPDYMALWDAVRCPLDLLPFLAWSLSVDYWRDDWSEAQKRAVIKTAIEVHQQKGTLAAIKTALDSIGLVAKVTEPKDDASLAPHEFKIEAFYNQAFDFNDQFSGLLNAVIEATKPARSYYRFYLSIFTDITLAFATLVKGHNMAQGNVNMTQKPRPPMGASMAIGMGGNAIAIVQSRFSTEQTLPKPNTPTAPQNPPEVTGEYAYDHFYYDYSNDTWSTDAKLGGDSYIYGFDTQLLKDAQAIEDAEQKQQAIQNLKTAKYHFNQAQKIQFKFKSGFLLTANGFETLRITPKYPFSLLVSAYEKQGAAPMAMQYYQTHSMAYASYDKPALMAYVQTQPQEDPKKRQYVMRSMVMSENITMQTSFKPEVIEREDWAATPDISFDFGMNQDYLWHRMDEPKVIDLPVETKGQFAPANFNYAHFEPLDDSHQKRAFLFDDKNVFFAKDQLQMSILGQEATTLWLDFAGFAFSDSLEINQAGDGAQTYHTGIPTPVYPAAGSENPDNKEESADTGTTPAPAKIWRAVPAVVAKTANSQGPTPFLQREGHIYHQNHYDQHLISSYLIWNTSKKAKLIVTLDTLANINQIYFFLYIGMNVPDMSDPSIHNNAEAARILPLLLRAKNSDTFDINGDQHSDVFNDVAKNHMTIEPHNRGKTITREWLITPKYIEYNGRKSRQNAGPYATIQLMAYQWVGQDITFQLLEEVDA